MTLDATAGDLTALDLFCGWGGMTLGLVQAGYQVAGGVDHDPNAVQTYRANHPQVPLWDSDIRTLTAQEVRAGWGHRPLDLLVGGPPCQGFSPLRTTRWNSAAADDPRNALIYEMFRFIEVLQPRAVLLENVPGLRAQEPFRRFQQRLTDMGYLIPHYVLNAAQYGVPPQRRRLLCLAGRRLQLPLAPPGLGKLTVRHAIGDLAPAGASGDPRHDVPEQRSPAVRAFIQRIPPDGGSRHDLPDSDQPAYLQGVNGYRDVYGRMAWGRPGPTLTTRSCHPSTGRFLHPEEHRAITLREAARLQGFPDTYAFPVGGRRGIGALIGNSVPPPLIQRLAAHMAPVLLAAQESAQ